MQQLCQRGGDIEALAKSPGQHWKHVDGLWVQEVVNQRTCYVLELLAHLYDFSEAHPLVLPC